MAGNKYLPLFLFILYVAGNPLSSLAQQSRHLIYFTDKNNSPYFTNDPSQFLSPKAIERRVKNSITVSGQDLPVNPHYLDSLVKMGAQVLLSSKWLNAALVLADPAQITAIQSYPFVAGAESRMRKATMHETGQTQFHLQDHALQSIGYGSSHGQLEMIGIDQMHQEGYHGEGLLIAVIDGGFRNVHTLAMFDSLRIHNRIKATYDFVDRETDVYDDHEHGMQVLSVIAGYQTDALIGGAWRADFLLLRSEDATAGGVEYLGEEVNWVRAAEFADSAGADIINSSLGYNTFDDPSTDHTYSDMDGKTTIITRGAEIAASKGILVINSMGNEGNKTWKYMVAPADGDSVLAVGGVTSGEQYFHLSSQGPSYDGRIKPDAAAQGESVVMASVSGGTKTGSGTSFAAPLITSLAAGLWQAFPSLTNMELLSLIQRSGSKYHQPDHLLGYGIPHFSAAKDLLVSNRKEVHGFPSLINDQGWSLMLPIQETGKNITLTFTDISGKIMNTEQIILAGLRNHLTTSPEHWAPGVYLLTVESATGRYVMKFLKMN